MHSDEFIDFRAISPVRLTMDGDFRYIYSVFLTTSLLFVRLFSLRRLGSDQKRPSDDFE